MAKRRKRTPWAVDETEDLRHMVRVQGLTVAEAGKRLGRTENACKAKLALLEGRRTRPGRQLSDVRPAVYTGACPGWGQAPRMIKTDEHKHLKAIMDADCVGSPEGCGFPVAVSRPTYRVAA